jgi:hypothetical protein
MARTGISVTAARHPCWNLPIFAPAENLRLGDSPNVRLIWNGGQTPGQVVTISGRPFLCWVIDHLPLGETRTYDVTRVSDAYPLGVDLIQVDDSNVEFRVGGSMFTSYHHGGVVRPFLYPVIGPGGKNLTRRYPMVPNVRGETDDHRHHRSVWVAHGDVNGSDNWSEERGCGTITHRQFREMTSGPVLARLCAVNDWLDNKGNKVMEEERIITVYNLPDAAGMIDFDIAFRATEGDVRFGDTKEGGIVSVRVATSMDGNKGGRITNSFGGVTEAECWGKPAHWCDYSGPVEGRQVGISIFDHPANFRHPTPWHVRDYGLMTANPFALSSYTGDPGVDGSHVVKSKQTFRFVYRLYIHDGDVDAGRIGEQYLGYVYPPAIEVP